MLKLSLLEPNWSAVGPGGAQIHMALCSWASAREGGGRELL